MNEALMNEILEQLKRANELKAMEVAALNRIAEQPKRDFVQAIQHWWCPDPSACMRMNY